MLHSPDGPDWVGLTRERLPIPEAVAWATTPASGAVVSFVGVVREYSDGVGGVAAITYEAYEEHAARVLSEVVVELRARYADVDRVALLHRVGDVALSEASVLVVVSAPHRGMSFDAARFAIDTVKETAPIWKREHHEHGSDWVANGQPVRPVRV